MSSPLLSALAKLDHSVRVLEGYLDCLGAGVDVPKNEFLQSVIEARQNVDSVRELIRARRPEIDWADRQSLEKLIRDLEAAEAGRKEQRLTKLLELAEELNAGTIAHRLKSRVTALEATRELAVRELLAEAANDEPKDLPGPHASEWMRWAFGLQDNAHAAEFSALEQDFPALVSFVCDMEESYWQPRASTPESSEQVAASNVVSPRQPAIDRPSMPLSEAAPSFAARYGHLSAAKATQVQTPAPANAPAVAPAPVREVQVPRAPLPIGVVSTPAAAHTPMPEVEPTLPRTGSVPEKPSPSLALEPPARLAEPAPLEAKPIIFPPFSLDDEDSGEDEGKGFRLNRSVVITIGAIAAIVVVMIVISAVSGSVSAKRSSPPPVASESAKEASAATPAVPISDIELVGQIEQKLKAIPGSSIYVTVQHGTAILEGQVASEEALSQAEELALQASQIKVVRDRLQVTKPGGPASTGRPPAPKPASSQ